jgi:hypothetical protein
MGKKPALWMFRSTVVMPKPISPRGAGFARLFVMMSLLRDLPMSIKHCSMMFQGINESLFN